MDKISWKNVTKKHPNGVCEAATSIWLQTISNFGITKANAITSQECDNLQEKIEAGTYTWATDLPPLLKSGTDFDAFEGPNITDKNDVNKILKGLKANQFVYISASNPHGNGHALALFYDGTDYYFFDPNHAIYKASAKEIGALAQQVIDNVKAWSEIAARIGAFH